MKKSIIPIILILFVSMAVALIYSSFATPLDEPLLYYNDNTWAREDRSPLKIIDGVEYVPLTIFAQMKNTKVRVNESLNTFVINRTALYISIDATTTIATDHSDKIYSIKTYKLDYGERYVPAEVICRHVGLGFDKYTNPVTGEIAVRITDGTEELSFEKLLKKYNPYIFETDKEDQSSETSEQSSESRNEESSSQTGSDSQKIQGKRTIYITFADSINDKTPSILDTLDSYGYKGSFFIDYEDIINNPTTIARIIAEGHLVGIKPRSASAYTDIDALISEINRTNDLLYRIYKVKTRSVMLDVMYTYNYDLINAVNSKALENEGYCIWKTNVDKSDGIYNNDVASSKLIDALIQKNVVVLRFGSNYATNYVLNSTLAFISRNRFNCDVRLAGPSFTPPR